MVGRIDRFGNDLIDPDPMPGPLEQHLSLLIRDLPYQFCLPDFARPLANLALARTCQIS